MTAYKVTLLDGKELTGACSDSVKGQYVNSVLNAYFL